MAKDIQMVADLFDGKKQYRTPRYQRRYVWEETNWKVLWEDITRIQRQLELGKDDKEHFTGTIVTRPDEIESALDKYEIIDGQQRLTTFQVIFCVIRDIAALPKYADSGLKSKIEGIIELPEYDIKREKSRIERIIKRSDIDSESDFSQYSLVLKGRDKDAFESLVKGEKSDQNSSVTDAYMYFDSKIRAYLGKEDLSKLQSLMDALAYNFHVVQVTLEPNDDPQQIFGSINGTGRILDEFDLLRNDLFLRVNDREKQEDWYRKYWCDFDEDEFWAEDGRLDEFLRFFLIAKLGPMNFSRKRLFHDVYKGLYNEKLRIELDSLNENDLEFVKTEFQELAKYAKSYQEMEDPTTNVGRRRQFYKDLNLIFENLDLTSLPPFMLAVENELGLDNNERDQVYKLLESYILRCQLAHGVNEDRTTSLRINALFSSLDLFSPLIKNEDKDIKKFGLGLDEFLTNDNLPRETWIDVDRIVAGLRRIGEQLAKGEKFSVALARLLSGRGVPGRTWLDNKQVLAGLRRVGRQIDSGSSSARRPVWEMLRYIFYRIECFKRKNSSTNLNGDKLGFGNFFHRHALIKPMSKSLHLKTAYSIGNLTFCGESLPEDFSFSKRKEILLRMPNASLLLNAEMRNYSTWGVKQILQDREKHLLNCFHEIWPPAEHFTREVVESKAEPEWISMIQSSEYQPVRFATYTKVVELSKIKTFGDKLIGTDPNDNEHTLDKRNIFFACSTEAWSEVGPYVEILGYLRKEHLHPPRNRDELFYVKDNFLTLAQREQTTVIPVTRYGHRLEGTIEDFDKEAIYMQIREHKVIVYRRSLHEFAIEDWHQGIVIEFDESRRFGHIQSGNLPRIFVHINEVMDRTVMSLQVGQKVEFDVNQTKRGLQAINVALVDE